MAIFSALKAHSGAARKLVLGDNLKKFWGSFFAPPYLTIRSSLFHSKFEVPFPAKS